MNFHRRTAHWKIGRLQSFFFFVVRDFPNSISNILKTNLFQSKPTQLKPERIQTADLSFCSCCVNGLTRIDFQSTPNSPATEKIRSFRFELENVIFCTRIYVAWHVRYEKDSFRAKYTSMVSIIFYGYCTIP